MMAPPRYHPYPYPYPYPPSTPPGYPSSQVAVPSMSLRTGDYGFLMTGEDVVTTLASLGRFVKKSRKRHGILKGFLGKDNMAIGAAY